MKSGDKVEREGAVRRSSELSRSTTDVARRAWIQRQHLDYYLDAFALRRSRLPWCADPDVRLSRIRLLSRV
jgi:hypothetical protein